MAQHLACADEAMTQIYPEYGPYKKALAAGLPHDEAFLLACAVVELGLDPDQIRPIEG